PWRQISWRDNKKQGNSLQPSEELKYVKNFQPQNDDVKYIRILLCGPVGAGKSSFINSVSNVLRGRMHFFLSKLYYNSVSQYETHKIQKDGKGNYYPFVFNDIMGLEDGTGRGVSAHDIKLALMGRVKEGHKFNPESPLSPDDPGYNSSPSLDDRVHVLVCVYSANVPEMRSSTLQKMKKIREAASNLGIPQMAVLTKVDQVCGETEKDLRNVYQSKHLKKKMADFSSSLGIPMNCILPVKNYSHEIKEDSDVDTLILSVLKLMINFGEDYINKLESNKAGC
uniref:G domain-containing protein n=1 Tax=Kryptolebias marmoratus TaxID=37003 RepID=A0A3Q2ZYL9_KRYMA